MCVCVCDGTGKSMKYCAEDGSWFAKSGREWTDFTPCVDKQVSDVTYIPFLHRDAEK